MKKKKGIIHTLVMMGTVLMIGIGLIFTAYAALGIHSNWEQYAKRKAETEEMQAKVAAQRIRNAALEEDIESDDKEGKMARAARDRLGLVNPGELIIVDMTP